MSPIAEFTKDPHATKPFMLDYGTSYLGSDSITNSEWIVPEGLTEGNHQQTSTTTTAWISGGVDGQSYILTNRITTAGGIVDDHSILIRCEDQ